MRWPGAPPPLEPAKSLNLSSMLEKIEKIEREATEALRAVTDADALEQFRIRYLGGKGRVKELMKGIKDVPDDQKKAFGQRANAARQTIEAAFESKKQELGATGGGAGKGRRGGPSRAPTLDVTEPGLAPRMGRRHPISGCVDELIDVFGRMGFQVATGPEVEDDQHNFVALNIPEQHPARDPLDNFYLDDPDSEHPTLLRSQTSTVQIRVMEHTDPPVRIISPGRVYRPDEHDATHYSMFHQIEGLYVDREVSMVDLKTSLEQFARAYWGADAQIKLVPSYFPFTEPSAEVYVKMHVRGQEQWIEVGGCGMVDPAVFEAVGYDPDQWTGFAFGLGVERLLMRKHGIPDIRMLFENDVRFLRKFP